MMRGGDFVEGFVGGYLAGGLGEGKIDIGGLLLGFGLGAAFFAVTRRGH